nr:MAG TPA: hypothetical protein [Caudoviricetes sp.]
MSLCFSSWTSIWNMVVSRSFFYFMAERGDRYGK